MALLDNAIVTLDEVKNFYFTTKSKVNDADNDLLEELINSVTSQFQNYCQVDSFVATDYTEVCSSIGCNAIFVKNIPINTITSVYIDGSWEFTDDTLMDSTSYRISNGKFILLQNYLLPGDDNIKVIYNAGYEVVPGDLKLACIKEVVKNYKHRLDFDVVSKSLENGSETYESGGLLRSTKQVINKYKRVSI